MKDFAAIDFEIANQKRTSICRVGVVVVRNRVVVERIEHLVRPTPNYYCYWATAIHNLTVEDTADAPDFVEVWAQIAPSIEGLTLVAHNSTFVEACLRETHEIYALQYPGYKFGCTLRSSRRLYPQLPNHQLRTVAAQVGYEMSGVGGALANAEACAAVMLGNARR